MPELPAELLPVAVVVLLWAEARLLPPVRRAHKLIHEIARKVGLEEDDGQDATP